MQLKKFAKGGKIIVQEKDYLKFSKLGIVNKYEIEAINDIGLANVKFDKESVLKLVEDKFQELLDKYEENLINEDSEIITKQIQYEIETLKTEGASLQSIEEKEKNITDNEYRKKLIDEYRQTQKDTAKTWVDYLKQSDYNTSFKYLILKAVLNFNYDLKQDKLFSRNEKTIRNITPFDASALAELYTKNSDFLLRDYINIQSENSLKVINSKGTIATNKNGRWIKFDGGEKTSDAQININAQELSRLVQNTFWCTKSNASGQLKGGDFYVYVTTENNNVQPRIAVRMNEDEVGEVRGNRSDKQDLEDEMLPIAEDFLIKNIPNNSGVKWLDSIKYNEKALYLRKKIKEAEFLTEDIFSEANKIIAQKDKYNVDYGENGNVTILISELKNKIDTLPSYDNKKNKLYYEEVISAYKILNEIEPSAYNDNVIESYQILIDLDDSNNENIVFKEQVTTNISEITSKTKYLLIFNTSYINNDWSNEMYSSLEYIYVKKAKFLSIPKKLKFISGDADFENSKITDLGNLTTIGGDAYFGNSKITDLGNLTTIGGYVFFHNSQITDLGKLKEVGEIKSYNTILYEKPNNIKTIKLVNFEDLPLLKTIKKIEKIEIKEIRQEKIDEIFNYGGKEILQKIEIEKINLYNSEASAILNIFTEINSHVEIKDCYALDLTNVKKIKSLSIIRTDILNFSVEEITESFYYNIGNFSVGDLKKIGSLEIRNTLNNYSLNNITEIRGEAIISEKALDLGKIEKIEGDFESKNSIKNNQYLKYVGGNLYWKGNDLGVLEYVGETLHLETGLVNLNNLKFCKSIQPNGASIESFGNLTSVTIEDRFIGLYYLKTFGNVKRITSTFEDFSISIEENIHLESLGNLEFIGGQLVFGSKLRDTGNLKKVKSLVVQNNENINFKSIEIIEKHFNLQRCKLNNFGSINYVGEINIESCEIDSFDNLKECDSLNVKNSLINSLSTLTTINNSCNILKSIVKSTGKLSRIGGDLILQETEVVDFNVEIIEGNASFRNSNVVSANKLETIKGDAWFGNSNLINMDSIKRILGSISYGDNTALKIKIEPILKQEMIKRGIFRNGGNILLKKK
jgi:hypothetical protein